METAAIIMMITGVVLLVLQIVLKDKKRKHIEQ
jgi:hypothetical protein